MSEKTIGETEQSESIETLVALIEKTGNANKITEDDRTLFLSTWVKVAREKGINSDSLQLLLNGYSFANAKPLYELARLTKAGDVYTAFYKTSSAMTDVVGFIYKSTLNLISYELISPTSERSLDYLVRKLVEISKKIKHESFRVKTDYIRRSLVVPLIDQKISDSVALGKVFLAKKFLAECEESLNFMIRSETSSPNVKRTSQMLLDWFSNQKGDATRDKATSLADAGQEEVKSVGVKSIGNTPSASVQRQARGASEAKKPAQKSSQKGNEADKDISITDVIKFLTEYKREHTRLVNSEKKLRTELGGANEQIDNLRTLLSAAKKEAEEERDQHNALSKKYASLQQELDVLKAENARLKDDHAAAENMLTMVEEKNAQQQEVANIKMVSELRFEYEDYEGALGQEMTIDLGNNMRDQLGNVFDILRSNGIDV